jgi:hypothetical protein
MYEFTCTKVLIYSQFGLGLQGQNSQPWGHQMRKKTFRLPQAIRRDTGKSTYFF